MIFNNIFSSQVLHTIEHKLYSEIFVYVLKVYYFLELLQIELHLWNKKCSRSNNFIILTQNHIIYDYNSVFLVGISHQHLLGKNKAILMHED